MSATTLRIGTRGSALALAQAAIVARALEAHGIDREIVIVETAGDRRAPDTAWGEGAFVTAIERALVEGRVDVAVHSAKDVPTDEDPRLTIAAYMARDDARDALVLPAGQAGSLDTLPAGTIVGTDSPRRTGFVRAYRADLTVQPLHGNVDTRLRRLDEGAVDALVLAAAGLNRLGREDRISQLLPVEVVPPAPGQGAICVQVRADDARAATLAGRLDDAPTRIAVEAERAFLKATGGGCRAPVGAHAVVESDRVRLLGGFA
ncbi:MAG TPA: hydroxymethylbilane synthase, partial [Chloroflexota bacterium]|nr:hydroxymethylbilane synthase [Chloroflexota bacterium]